MKNGLYVIYNNLSNRYGQVFTEATDACAIRFMQHLDENLPKEANERELCKIGEIEIETGIVTSTNAPIRIPYKNEHEKMPIKEASNPITNEEDAKKLNL